MLEYLIRPVAHEAFFKKYASKKFLKGEESLKSSIFFAANFIAVSILIRDWAKRHHPLYLDADIATAYVKPPKETHYSHYLS